MSLSQDGRNRRSENNRIILTYVSTDPFALEDAIKSEAKWLLAMQSVLESLGTNGTRKLVELISGNNAVKSKCVFNSL